MNCGAIPDALVENELFGHGRGAYTDAKSEQPGIIAHAQHGTLFLDEVDSLTPKSQVALLRFLQDQQYRPLGGSEVRSADVRVIAASNGNLASLTEQGTPVSDGSAVPPQGHASHDAAAARPSRRRGDAVGSLSESLRATLRRRRGPLHPETSAWMDKYAWPGNIRELENLVYREFLLADGRLIEIRPPDAARSDSDAQPDGTDVAVLSFRQAKTRAIAEFERRYLADVLSAARGNVTRAARLVGKERRAFGRLLKKHDIDKTVYRR